jgi:hypothetical protein
MAYVAWRVSTAGGPGREGWFRAAEEGREVAAQQTRYWRLELFFVNTQELLL